MEASRGRLMAGEVVFLVMLGEVAAAAYDLGPAPGWAGGDEWIMSTVFWTSSSWCAMVESWSSRGTAVLRRARVR